ncbi:uncharacterized protein EAE97_008806 [Botrytis byssoidea]|uniref:Uncharacterized protein n=1 Tax=Botrytis byssoidea TaxID=139641 RepID=A0A9P5IBY2_9HELO|nr:uncharacterized protein EAE97_008806 [Botrytis byssoidea]KAF7933039.1 hypothetical protein EAE97_008806 [Botrytis byssoidea]
MEYNARPVSSLEIAPAVIIYGTTHSSHVVNLALYSSYYGKTHIITDHERVIACFQKPANNLETSKSQGKRGKGNEPDKANPSTRENNPNKHAHSPCDNRISQSSSAQQRKLPTFLIYIFKVLGSFRPALYICNTPKLRGTLSDIQVRKRF